MNSAAEKLAPNGVKGRNVGTAGQESGEGLGLPPYRLTAVPPTCTRCGFPLASEAWGCKNPCLNCGTIYPLGDCSD